MKKKHKAIVVIVVIIFIAFAVLIYLGATPRSDAQRYGCINNLRMIDSAKESWALANNKHRGAAPVISELNQYIKGSTTPTCPAGGTYSYNVIGSEPTCSITKPKIHCLPK